jgi:hypothetical protein
VCRTRYLFSAPWNPPAQSVTLSGTGANPTFSWSAPAGLMADGYRIQIFQNNPNIGAIIAANLTHPTYTVKGSAWRMQKPLGWPMSRSKQLRDVASSQAIHQQILLVQIIRSVPGSADVRRNPVADRPATGAARLSMRVAEVGRYRRQPAGVRLDSADAARFSAPAPSTYRLKRLPGHVGRDLPLPNSSESASLALK